MGTGHNPAIITSQEIGEIQTLIAQRSGIQLQAGGELLAACAREHMVSRRLSHGTDLLRHLRHSSTEYEALLEKLLVHQSMFFRHPAAFETFARQVLPEVHMKKFWESPRSLRVWSAGCGDGEEAYSIALTIAETLEVEDGWAVNILATDVSRQALQHAERGVYASAKLAGLAPGQLEAYFSRIGDHFIVKPQLREMVSFMPLNLSEPEYPGRFDCIFCMDVLSYFTPEKRAELVQRFHDCLEPGGYLFFADGEEIAEAPVTFQCVWQGNARVCQKPLGPTGKLSEGVRLPLADARAARR